MNERELRVIRALANEVRALQQEIQATRKGRQSSEDRKTDEPVQPLRIEVTVTPQLDPAQREYYEAENRDRESLWRKLKPWVETIGVLVAVALAVFNLLVLMQIQQQTPQITKAANAASDQVALARQQAEGGSAAVLYLGSSDISLSPCCTVDYYINSLQGRADAQITNATMTISILSLPDKRVVGEPQIFSIDPQPIRSPKTPDDSGSMNVRVGLNGITQSVIAAVSKMHRVIRVEQNLIYTDGFKEMPHTVSRCRALVVTGFHEGEPDKNTETTPNIGGVDCAVLDVTLRESLRIKEIVDVEYKKRVQDYLKTQQK